MIVGVETKNADATVAALQTDTVYTLLSPAGVTVVPGSVKATLGAPVVPTPSAPTDGSAPPADGSTEGDSAGSAAPSDSGSSDGGGGSNTGAIVGAVVGVVAVVAIGGGIAFVVSPLGSMGGRPPAAAAETVGRCWGQVPDQTAAGHELPHWCLHARQLQPPTPSSCPEPRAPQMIRRRRARAAEAQESMRTHSFNPTFQPVQSGVTATSESRRRERGRLLWMRRANLTCRPVGELPPGRAHTQTASRAVCSPSPVPSPCAQATTPALQSPPAAPPPRSSSWRLWSARARCATPLRGCLGSAEGRGAPAARPLQSRVPQSSPPRARPKQSDVMAPL